MPGFNLDNYETVEDRLVKFWADHTDGRIITSIHYYDDTRILVRAEVYFDREDVRPVATGYAEELRGASPVNRTSHAENAETSAIGRALANCGYAAKGARPSREEMQKVERGDVWVSRPTQPAAKPAVNDKQAIDEMMDSLVANGAVYVDNEEQERPRNISIKNPNEPASPKQLGMLRAVLRSQGISDNKEVLDLCSAAINRNISKLDELEKGEASALITQYK
jgi:hypothetical protein